MSIVRDFATAMHAQAAPMIGQEAVTIDGFTILAVMPQAEVSKDFMGTGRNTIKTLRATFPTAALPTFEILKKQATARGETWRVESVSKGSTFVTITMEQETKA
jgi:hypothetical protein